MHRRPILCPMTRHSRVSAPRIGPTTPGVGSGSGPTLKPRTTGTWNPRCPAKMFLWTISSRCGRKGPSHLVTLQPTVYSTVSSSIYITIKYCRCTLDWPSYSDPLIQASYILYKNYEKKSKILCMPVWYIWKQDSKDKLPTKERHNTIAILVEDDITSETCKI